MKPFDQLSHHGSRTLAAVTVLALALGAPEIFGADMRQPAPRPATRPAVAVEPVATDPVIARLATLSPDEELAVFLGSGAKLDGRRYTPAARLARLVADPALATVYPRIDDRWLAVPGTEALRGDTRGTVEIKVMVARNLYFRGREATAQSVRDEALRIVALRRRYQELAMFGDRQVLFAASDDEHRGGGHVFGRLPTRQRLAQIAGRLDFLRPGESPDLERRLSETLGSAERLTFLFEGHGRGDALKLDGALGPRQLARLLARRATAAGDATPILILDACQSHNFSRTLLAELERLAPSVRPIIVTPEEYGQDFVKPGHGDPFLDRDLGISYRDRVTFGDLFVEPRTMASVYVPGDDGRPAQIL